MAILIKQDGRQQLVQPANGRVFSQEIQMYGDLGWIPMGIGEELDRKSRPAKMEGVQ